MRILIFLLSLMLTTGSAFAQRVQENRTQRMAVGTWVVVNGFRVPVSDTTCTGLLNYADTLGCLGALVVRPQDGNLYQKGLIRWNRLGGADSAVFATNYRLDTVKANLRGEIGQKLNISDTAAMLGPYALEAQIPAQFNPIAGTNITLSGSYPNITFNAAGGLVADSVILNRSTFQDKQFNIRTGRLDSLFARGSGGFHLVSNSGTSIANFGDGGGSNATFNGFAGYDANRAASYTARSFTDRNYVDSVDATKLSGSGTANRVAYWTGTTALSSNSNLIWDNTNNRLGIGISPSSPLHVYLNSNTSNRGVRIENASSGANAITGFELYNNTGNMGSVSTYSSSFGTVGLRNNMVFGSVNNMIIVSNGATETGGATNFIGFRPGGFADSEARIRFYRAGAILSDATVSTTPNASSVLELVSTSRGFLPPRMTAAQRNAITSPASGLQVYNTTDSGVQVFNGAFWGVERIIYKNNATTVSASTTPVTDPELQVALEAGVYRVEFNFITNTSAGGWRYTITGPSLSTWSGTRNIGGNPNMLLQRNSTTGTTVAATGGGNNMTGYHSFVWQCDTAGSLQINWAQNTASGTATIFEGSFMKVTRIK